MKKIVFEKLDGLQGGPNATIEIRNRMGLRVEMEDFGLDDETMILSFFHKNQKLGTIILTREDKLFDG